MSRTRCGTCPSSSSASADLVSTLPTSPLYAAGPPTVGELLHGQARPAAVLGAFPTAMYLRVTSGEIIGLLTRDAVLLPLGLRLSTHSADDPLDRWTGPVRVGSYLVQVGDRSVRLSRVVSVRAPTGLEPNRRAVAYASRRLGRLAQVDPRPGLLEVLLSDQRVLAPAAVVSRFLGVGPGLTPSGDDILAGFLVGAWSFRLADDPLRTAVLEAAPAGTTDLSAALLRCASRGESLPQVSAFLRALAESPAAPNHLLDDALVELGHVGHTSGAALAAGAVAAAQVAAQSLRQTPLRSLRQPLVDAYREPVPHIDRGDS
jgi:hypothetical protein